MDRVQGVVTQAKNAKEEAKAKKEERTPQKAEDIYYISYDKKTGNYIFINKDNYNQDGTKKKTE